MVMTSRPAGNGGKLDKLSPEALELVASRFRALGDPIRLRILQALEPFELNVSTLTDRVGSTQPNISKHLRVLQEAGLVRRQQQGSIARYSIADRSVYELCELVCAGVRRRLESQVGALTPRAPMAGRGGERLRR
jgi:ArsR family transcriptional regulator